VAKSKAFDFQACAARMVQHLGAKPEDSRGGLLIDTVAGPMSVHAYENWVACRFHDVERAKKVSPPGSLNPYSGKWNWHGNSPSVESLKGFLSHLCSVVPASAELEEIVRPYDLAARQCKSSSDLSVRLSYQYRDGSNYKARRDVVLSGAPRYAVQIAKVLRGLDESESCPSLIPGLVGLPDLQDSFSGCSSRWDPDEDHPWHELLSVELIEDYQGEPDGDFGEFADQVFQAAFVHGWDESYRPDSYPEMAARQEAYERTMREQEGA